MINVELEIISKGTVLAYSRYCPGTGLEEVSKTTKDLHQDI
jgi:hypothetical protein